MSVAGKVVIVTGAAQGIGRGVALRLAEDGFDVAVNDLASQRPALDLLVAEIQSKSRRSLAVVADVSVEDDVKAMIARVVDVLGSVDVMVANAGIAFSNTLLTTSCEEWDRTQAVNTRGVFLCYKYAALQMVSQGKGGRIIGACSMAGKRGNAMSIAYSTSKFAIRGLTQTLELGKLGITVNAYAPGPIDTPMTQTSVKIMTEQIEKQTGGPVDVNAMLVGMTTVGRMGTTQDVASVVSFLASPHSDFITGQTISVDGGINLS
ncbi:NAD-P-binding protein [Mycena epipterygia]|nr:NAD-P-binding protein [Mycena epipterygia]